MEPLACRSDGAASSVAHDVAADELAPRDAAALGGLHVLAPELVADRETGDLSFAGHYAPVGNPLIIVFLDLSKAG